MSDDAAKKQCEILDEAQRRFGHQVSQWREAGQSVLNEAFPRAVPPAMQRAPIIEVPNNVNQAQVLVTRMFESLQADVARNHEFVATMMSSLENCIMEQQHFGVMLAELRERQQLIMQKLEVLPSRVNVADALEIFARQQFAEFDKLAKFANFLPKRARKRQPKPVRPASKRKSTRKL